MDQYIGRLLDGRYEVLDILGTGGMAVVYRARCHRLNRLVALKILKDEFARDEEFRRRFRAEGEAVAMLSHPNIVQVYDVSTSDDANFIVMELIDGISLKQYMEKKGVLNWKETLHFGMQIAKGLEHAHSRGIVHRDIKPHNVMVLKNGSVKVMDFGIARVMNKSNTLTKEALGSVHYISPEQAKGGHTDNRSDIYSLSVVMYEMMAGRPPYDGESAVSVAIQHINGGAPMPSTYNPNVPSGLEQIIMKGMALEIRDRYVSATEMLQDMEEFRKNPAIRFEYRTILDDATRSIPTAVKPAKTMADKAVQAKTGNRASTDSMRIRQAAPPRRATGVVNVSTADQDNEIIRRAQQRRKVEEQRQEQERSRVATTAIVVCSAVAVIAIIIFLVALFNGALLNQERDTVTVPYLVGEMYSEGFAQRHSNFNIRMLPQEYDDAYVEGQIMRQEPSGGEEVQRGADLWITVSMGKEPPVKLMEDYVDVSVDQVQKVLDDMGFVPLVRNEVSYVYAAGQVIRTDPMEGTELTDGQTIYLYVSTGPEILEASMPNVVGMKVKKAQELLEDMGFKNLRIEPTESRKPKDEVVYQSVAKNTMVDVTKEIIIHYSQGPETTETTQPTYAVEETEPTEVQGQSFWVAFALPEREKEYTLDICLNGSQDVIYTRRIPAGVTSTSVELSGVGTVYYDLYIDGVFQSTQKVEFTKEVEPDED